MADLKVIERDGLFYAPDGRRAYPFNCCQCGHKMFAAKSISMTDFNVNSGWGKCSHCGALLRLAMAPNIDGDCMISFLHGTAEAAVGLVPNDK